MDRAGISVQMRFDTGGDPRILIRFDSIANAPLEAGDFEPSARCYASSRLDFTVIGRAVNEASRVEALTKEVGRPLLITGLVAKLLDREIETIGTFLLKGVEVPVEVFAPKPVD